VIWESGGGSLLFESQMSKRMGYVERESGLAHSHLTVGVVFDSKMTTTMIDRPEDLARVLLKPCDKKSMTGIVS
jgi:hypothetical protein